MSTTDQSKSISSVDDAVDDALPNDVSTLAEVACLPDKFLSNIKRRPTKCNYTINAGTETETHIYLTYALKPLRYCVMFILFYQILEAFAFYGSAKTETRFLLGSYNVQSWGVALSAAQASTFTSVTQGLAWSSPLMAF